MKTVTMLQRFYYHKLEDGIKEAICFNFETYAFMMHPAYRIL